MCACQDVESPNLLSSQLPMVSAVVLSGDGRDERGAAGAVLHVPVF